MLVFRLTCSQVLVDFLECIDEDAARVSLLPATVCIHRLTNVFGA
jgi:hypothetical protein